MSQSFENKLQVKCLKHRIGMSEKRIYPNKVYEATNTLGKE